MRFPWDPSFQTRFQFSWNRFLANSAWLWFTVLFQVKSSFFHIVFWYEASSSHERNISEMWQRDMDAIRLFCERYQDQGRQGSALSNGTLIQKDQITPWTYSDRIISRSVWDGDRWPKQEYKWLSAIQWVWEGSVILKSCQMTLDRFHIDMRWNNDSVGDQTSAPLDISFRGARETANERANEAKEWMGVSSSALLPACGPGQALYRLSSSQSSFLNLKPRLRQVIPYSWRNLSNEQLSIVFCWTAGPKDREGTHWYAWVEYQFTSPDLAVACSLKHEQYFLPRWNSIWNTAFNLGTTPGTFLGTLTVRQCAHNSDALQCITFPS
jgi:hypothetical protein